MDANHAPAAWQQIKDTYFLTGDVDSMLKLRHALYDEILAAQQGLKRHHPVFSDKDDELRARAIAASLFILMLEKKKAAEVLHPYVDKDQYPDAVVVNHDAITKLERQAHKGALDAVAVGSILTHTANFCYRCFFRDYHTGLRLTKAAESLFAATQTRYTTSPEKHLPFLLARHENFLHLSLFQWRAGGEQMSESRTYLERSLNELTIAYERYLAREQHIPFAGSIEVILTQTLGTLAERLWIEEPETGWAKARIYRSLQTVPRIAAKHIPGRSVDTCRRGYAFILASRIEATDTTTNYRHAIALAKNAEWCFDNLAEFLEEKSSHAWRIRARTQRLRCYIQAKKTKPAAKLVLEITDEIETITDPEEQDFAKGSLALARTWILEREAENAPPDQREEKWRECLAQARQIIQSERIPGRLKRDGLLHQGRALLNIASCLRHKKERTEDPHSYEIEGCKLVNEAIAQAKDRHRPKTEAAGHLALAQGLKEIDPSAAAASLREAARLLMQGKSTYLQSQLESLLSDAPVPEDGFVTLSLNLNYDEVLKPALEAAYFDYHYRKAQQFPVSGQGVIGRFLKNTQWNKKQFERVRARVYGRRGIAVNSRAKEKKES